MTSTEQQQVIHPKMTIEQILSGFPGKAQRLAQEITNAGLHCVGCGAATWETLESGMLGHGMTLEMVHKLTEKLNAVLAEKEDLTTVAISPKAAQKFLAILKEEGKDGWGMRFAEQMAGCNGFEYVLDFSEKALPDDTIFESNGIEIHVKTVMASRLRGCAIDYVEGLTNSGFKISNPNAKSSCGCGSSHGY
jgi:iron-sulfur cluster assembly accessory protein